MLSAAGGIALIAARGENGANGDSGAARTLTPATAIAALSADGAAGSFRLMPGIYPPLTIRGDRGASRISVASADPAHPAILRGLTLHRVTGAVVRDLIVEGAADAEPRSRALLLVRDASDVLIDRIVVRGPAGGTGIPQYYGAMLRGGSNVRVTDSRFSGTRYGLGFLRVARLEVAGNELTGLQTDGIRGGGSSDLLIRGNVIGDFAPAPTDHPDGIQLWSANETEPARRIAIRDNVVVRGAGGRMQGIFVRDNKLTLPFEDLEISGNLIIGSMYNGIAVQGATRATIRDNRVYAFPDMKAWIRVASGRDVRLENNLANFYIRDKLTGMVDRGNRLSRPVRKGVGALVQAWATERGIVARPGSYLSRMATAD